VAHRKKQLFHVAVLIVGGVVLAVIIDQLGWGTIESAIVDTGAWFGVMAAIDLVSAGFDAYAVQAFVAPRVPISYRTAFAAQLSGMAINRLTPGNSLGEPVKVTTLARSVPGHVAVSAIVMFNITTAYVAIAGIVIGVPITLLLLDLPRELEILVWIGTAALIAGAIAIAVIVRRGAVATLIDVLSSTRILSPARATRWHAAIADIDTRLRELGGNTRTSGLRRGLVGVVTSRVLNWVGTIVVLHAAAIPLRPVLVVATLSVGLLVQWMSNIIPLGLGIADGTNYALYGLLGASPAAGVVFTIVNRLRTIVLALMGLTVMAIAHVFRRDRSLPPDPPR
jgi:uncharacterized protein (TIRG00374 family)